MDITLKQRFDSIIFDLDGTLWDSTAGVAFAWQSAKEEVDYVKYDITAEQVAGIAGMAYDAIYDSLFPELNTEQREAFKLICAKKELDTLAIRGGVLYPNLLTTIGALASEYKLFIVSNCQSGYIEVFLDFYDLREYFTGFQSYGTKGQPKAENIKDIVSEYELKSPVYVGDTQGDYESSRKAGVPFIFAAYGFGYVPKGSIAKIDSLLDLVEIL
ncbi:5'-methylthioadenosine nucleosidase [Arcticibacter svalbardensis MN12-7]|uniref:phosphoglycolate phosphatase n=2 Tax=Arcticibacter TaxID=1288026 RepID=R9GVD4_9SPHI|nr:5'-methylthioadenosine nucleosidase [Arcticibacter svalbardensis MN12-7]